MGLYEKDILQWIEIFSSEPQQPENIKSTEPEQPVGNIQSYNAGKGRGAGGGGGGGQRYIDKGGPQGKASGWRGQPYRGDYRREQVEEDEDDEDPEWVDFDPTKETGSFFGRAITNEDQVREQVKKEKERNLAIWGGKHETNDDQFERLVNQEKEEARKKAENNQELL